MSKEWTFLKHDEGSGKILVTQADQGWYQKDPKNRTRTVIGSFDTIEDALRAVTTENKNDKTP
jgi:hypothetical protein